MAEAAEKAIQTQGHTTRSLRMLYRALELDPFQPKALLLLSKHYRGDLKGTRPTGDEILSGIIIEYAMDPKSALPASEKKVFEHTRLSIMTSWGFAKPRGTETDIDHIGYMTYINELMGQVRSVSNGFRIAMAKLGVQAGALDPAKGQTSRNYQEWLRAGASTLQA
jgi:hypothetical protein